MSRMLEAAGSKKRPRCDSSSVTGSKIPRSGESQLKLSELSTLCFAARHIPERTPKKWELVSKFVFDNADQVSPDVQLTFGRSLPTPIQRSPHELKDIHRTLCSEWKNCSTDCLLQMKMGVYSDRSALKSLVLLPSTKECCDTPTIIRNRPTFPLVYTMQGTFVAAMYTAECKHCTRKFHLSFYTEQAGDNSQVSQFFYDPEGAKYFQISSQTLFEVALLHDITNNVSISAASFESRATVYNENFMAIDKERLSHLMEFGRSQSDKEHPWKLTEKRIEDTWFVYTLVNFYKQMATLNTTDFATEKMASQRYDVESMCERA